MQFKQSNLDKKKQNMTALRLIKSIDRSSSRLALLLIPLGLVCFALSPAAQALVPAPDEDYPNGNSAEGDNALSSPTTDAHSTYEPYSFTTFAGLPPGSTDGTGSAARFNSPGGVARDNAGNTYVADTVNSTIRKITPAGVVTTFAGLAGSTGSANGTGSAARFNGPIAVAIDSIGNIFVADTNNTPSAKSRPLAW